MPRGQYDRSKMKSRKQEPVELHDESVLCPPTRLWASLDASGIVLKLVVGKDSNPNHILGTLEISTTGIKFLRSNAKKKPKKELTYAQLENLHKLGLL